LKKSPKPAYFYHISALTTKTWIGQTSLKFVHGNSKLDRRHAICSAKIQTKLQQPSSSTAPTDLDRLNTMPKSEEWRSSKRTRRMYSRINVFRAIV